MRLFMLLGVVMLTAGVACSGGDDSGDASATSESSQTAEAGGSATTSAESTATGEAGSAVVGSKYIGATDGGGVSIRDACRDDARVGGSWPDGAGVVVIEAGSGDCAEWSYVAGSGGASWVRDRYLVDQRPAAPAVSSGGSTGGGSVSTPGPTPVASTPAPTSQIPPFEFVALGGRVLSSDDIDGRAELFGGEARFIYPGLVSSSPLHPDSICNPTGKYGGVWSGF